MCGRFTFQPTEEFYKRFHADMYVSTLRHVIEAMGGRLEIRAVFPEGNVRITQFQRLAP